MAKTTLFMLSNAMANIPDSNGNLIQQLSTPLLVIRPQAMPSNFSFIVTVGVQGLNVHNINIIRMVFIGPDNSMVHDCGELELQPMDIEDTLPPEYQGIILNADMRNVFFNKEGCYKIAVIVNGNTISEHDVPVFQGGAK